MLHFWTAVSAQVEPEEHDCVTIFFSDIVGFTDIARRVSAMEVMDMLDRLYERFDALCIKSDIFKVPGLDVDLVPL